MKNETKAPRPLLAGLSLDLRSAVRAVRRAPVASAVIVVTLTLGIGGATAIFGVAETVFWSALPFADGERLVRLRDYAITAEGAVRGYNMTPRDFFAIREGNRVFEDVVAQQGFGFALLGGEGAERLNVTGVSPRWAETLRLEPRLGRVFTADEESAGRDAGVALLSHGQWQGRFGGDPDILGRQLSLTAGTFTVVGVMPPGFVYPYDADLWVPWRWDRSEWQAHDLNVVARMRDGVTVERVERDMGRLYRALAADSPGTTPDSGIEVTLVRDNFVVDQAQVLRSLAVAVGFLLLLACANVASLMAAQFHRRRRQIGLRAALGAGSLRQIRQLVTESVVLFALGALGALLLTAWMGDALLVLVPEVLRTQLALGEIRISPLLLAFGFAMAVVGGVAFGALAARSGARCDLRALLSVGSGGAAGPGARRLQRALVVLQVSLSLVLLVGAGLLARHFRDLQRLELGYDLAGLSTLMLDIGQEPYQQPAARLALVRQLQERLLALPDVEAVGITTVNPLCCGDWGASIEVDGRPPDPDSPILVHHRYVAPGYFAALGIPVVTGQDFSRLDSPQAAPTVIVDENLARRFWPGEDPLGKRLRSARGDQPWRTVIGVVPSVYREGDYTEAWYLPYFQDPLGRPTDRLHVMLRARGGGPIAAARAAVAEIDPTLAVHGAAKMAELRRELISQERLGAVTAILFAGFGLLLAACGLFAMLSHEVERRGAEIGVRMALGATRGRVLQRVMRETLPLVAAGTALGLLLSLATNQLLRSVVEGLGWMDLRLVAPLLAVMLAVSAAALVVPALRAARADPLQALREG